jgi:hypothetical protein
MESRPSNKVPDGQFVKNSPSRYLNRDKIYGSRKNPFRQKKSTGEKILTLMESHVQPQRRLVQLRFLLTNILSTNTFSFSFVISGELVNTRDAPWFLFLGVLGPVWDTLGCGKTSSGVICVDEDLHYTT